MKWFLSTLQQLSVLCSCEAVKVIDAQCTESNVCLATGIAAKTLPHRSPLVTHRSGPMRAQARASLCSHLLSLTPLPCAVITWRARHMLRLTVGVSSSQLTPPGLQDSAQQSNQCWKTWSVWSVNRLPPKKYLYNGETPIGFSIQPMYRLIYGVTKMFVNVGCHLLQLSTRCPIHQN